MLWSLVFLFYLQQIAAKVQRFIEIKGLNGYKILRSCLSYYFLIENELFLIKSDFNF